MQFRGVLGACWGPLWEPRGASWRPRWALLGPPGGFFWRRARNVGSCPPSENPLGVFLGPPWAVLEASWAILGASRDVSAPFWGLLGRLGAIIGAFWAALERREAEQAETRKTFKPQRRSMKLASWGPLGGPLGVILGRLRGALGCLEAILGVLERSFGDSWPSWAVLGASWPVLGFSWPRKAHATPGRFQNLGPGPVNTRS